MIREVLYGYGSDNVTENEKQNAEDMTFIFKMHCIHSVYSDKVRSGTFFQT